MNKNEFLSKQLDILKNIQNGDMTWSQLVDFRAEFYSDKEHVDTVRRGSKIVREYLDANWIHKPNETSIVVNDNNKKISINKDGSQSSESKFNIENVEDLKDSEFLLRLHGYDAQLWNIVSASSSQWGGSDKRQYSSKITVKLKDNKINHNDILKHFDEFSKRYKHADSVPISYEYGSELLVPCLFDVHFAKLADIDECGEKYDYKIAKRRVINSVKQYIDRLKNRKFEKIIFVVGNDYFNSESNGDTVNNTRQDNDSRYGKIFNKGVETLIEAIDMFATIAPVEVILIQGNHSFYAEFYASCVLNAWYRNSKVVSVDNSPTVRKYVRFGSNLIGFSHGSEEKDRIYGLMQCEASSDWGETTTHEWLIGHVHHELVSEKNGVVVRRIPSLTGHDAWHVLRGYTTAKKRSMAFIYDKEQGLIETHYVNIIN